MAHHYLGPEGICGRRVLYVFKCAKGVLGAASFSAAAWHLKGRDRWIGWTDEARRRNLQLVVNNSRFCLLPRIKNLASHLLAKCLGRLPDDWEQEYGYRPALVETFVDRSRFDGTCYVANGWTSVGETTGRGRQGNRRGAMAKRARKTVFLKELGPDAKARLCFDVVRSKDTTGRPFEEIEFGEADFKDRRLTERLIRIGRNFKERVTANIPEASRSEAEAKATYRFFENPKVKEDEILKPHFEASLRRAKGEQVVLAIQDTTSFNYSTHDETEGLGPIASSQNNSPMGILLHSTLLLNDAGTPLGLIDAQFWVRDLEQMGRSRQRYAEPIESKESAKWLKSYQAASLARRRLETTTVVSVGDREADIYELFLDAKKRPGGAELLVRALHRDRRLEVEDGQPTHLRDFLRSKEPVESLELKLTSKKLGGPRKATVELRFAPVRLRPPSDKRQFKDSIDLWGILVSEAGEERSEAQRVEWILLSTLPVTTVEECREKVRWYTLRWQIEVYHRALKSGCNVESRQLRSATNLRKCIAVDLVMAYHVFNMTKLARESPDALCTIAFEEMQWKALVAWRDQNGREPTTPPSIREAVRLTARLGGFLGRKCDGEPGNTTLWRGLQHLEDMAAAFRLVWRGGTLDTT